MTSGLRRRTQVVKGEVCKTSMQRFESARRLSFLADRLPQSTGSVGGPNAELHLRLSP